MLILAVALALLVGISLGMLGGGGSILAVPLLVYVAGLGAQEAVATSLLVVGVTSAVGVLPHARAGRVQWRTAFIFGVGGMSGAYLGGRLATHVPGQVLLVAFAVMMLATSLGMMRGRRSDAPPSPDLRVAAAIGLGMAVGLVTGFVGAGGGFLIVPALVLIGGLPMTQAIGTSLLVIALQSAAGLAGHLSGTRIPWGLAVAVTVMAVLGSLIGSRLSGRIHPDRLRRGFGWLVLAMAFLVLGEQLPAVVAALTLTPLAIAVTAVTLIARRRARPSGIYPPGYSLNPVDTGTRRSQETSMYFAQHYLDCLSQASYLIGDEASGQAVVVDPRRDVQEYLDDAAAHGLSIVGVINTHFHADFLAGHLEMAQATGAWIGYGDAAQTEYESRSLADGERIVLGDTSDSVTLQIMTTPGHTPESISVLVYEHGDDDVAYGVLTGDALFIGDVGRPDLLASIGVTADELGVQLYDSIQRKLMGLPDPVRVFPAHGAGSACGKNLSTARQSTIGEQRVLNYACQPMTQEEFVALVTAGQPAAPEYFVYDAILNRKDREVYDATKPVPAMDAADLAAALGRGAVLVDARDTTDFAAGHLTGAINVPADGRFAETAGMVLQPGDEVVVMAPEGRHEETAVRLARIGFDHVIGYLPAGETVMVEHPELVSQASRLTPVQLAELTSDSAAAALTPVVVDVRNSGEREAGYIPGSMHIPLAELHRRAAELPADRPLVAYCAGGWRSSVAASLLRHEGRTDVSDLLGGFAAWSAMHEPVSA